MREPNRPQRRKAKAEPGAAPFGPRDEGGEAGARQAVRKAHPHEDEELLALAQEAGGLGIFEWQVRNGTVRLSPKLQALYGLSDFDGRHETWIGCIFREDVLRVSSALDEAFAARASEIVLEFRIVPPGDGTPRWMETHNLIFYDDRGEVERLVAVSVDVTDRKRALVQLRAFTEALEDRVRERTRELEAENAARAKAEESLRQAQKMEAVGQLTGGVAHDFNNLLTIILGGLEIIERHIPTLPESPATARIDRASKMAREGADRAAKLTERLLAFARQQPLSPQSVDANALISGLGELLRRTLGESIALVFHTTGEIWHTRADPNQLENALLNLAANARDAMQSGGTLTIETGNCELDDAFSAAQEEPIRPGEYVMISVADTGTGMNDATIAHAFEPFFTTKEVGKGTGLGLSQVYGFVRQSSGHVRIDSADGRGTAIKIYLPRYLGATRAGGVAPGRGAAGAIGTECVLVVEDDESLRAYTTGVLRQLGYRVLEAEHGPAALRVLRQDERIDLLFTDIVMPSGMNGRELADAARAIRPGLKTLFTTGYSRNAISERDRLDFGVQVIGKPFSIDSLAAKVRDSLDGNDGG